MKWSQFLLVVSLRTPVIGVNSIYFVVSPRFNLSVYKANRMSGSRTRSRQDKEDDNDANAKAIDLVSYGSLTWNWF